MATLKKRKDGKASNATNLRIDEKLVMTGKRGRPRVAKVEATFDDVDLTGHDYRSLRKARRGLYHPKRAEKSRWQCGDHLIPDCDELTALLFSFKHAPLPQIKEYLFWEIADILWNSDPDEPKFEKHKWSYEIIHHACRETYLSIGGAANVGKSYVCAGWGIVNWLCDPANTIVLMTSTDREGAKKRVWGCMKNLLDMVPEPPMKESYSIGAVPYWDGVKKPSSTAGIFLVTADKSKDKDKVGKLIGIHAPRVFLIADELSDISENVLSAATGNLEKNPYFQMIGMSNPSSRFDPFGLMATPKGGWTSVNEEVDYEWMTRYGRYIRIDSELSPNIVEDTSPEYPSDVFYVYLPTDESIEKDLSNFGDSPEEARKSRNYMRFNRAIFFDGGEEENLYSESAFMKAGALDRTVMFRPTLIAGCDPSFSSGGDNTVMVFLEEGFDSHTQHVVQFKEMVYLYEDSTDKENPRTLQIADKIIAECKKRGIPPENFALDASSGAGKTLADVLQLQWGSNAFLRVEFGGAASDRRIKNDSNVTGKDRYANRASELFFMGQTYLIGRQLYGIPPIIAKQFSQRAVLPPKKGPNGIRLQVEPKKLFKARVGKSPDEQDAYLVAVELARTRHMFTPLNPVARVDKSNDMAKWLGNRRTHASYAADKMGFVGNL